MLLWSLFWLLFIPLYKPYFHERDTQSGHFRLVTFREEFFMGFSLGLKQNPHMIIKYNFALFSAYVFHPVKGSYFRARILYSLII